MVDVDWRLNKAKGMVVRKRVGGLVLWCKSTWWVGVSSYGIRVRLVCQFVMAVAQTPKGGSGSKTARQQLRYFSDGDHVRWNSDKKTACHSATGRCRFEVGSERGSLMSIENVRYHLQIGGAI